MIVGSYEDDALPFYRRGAEVRPYSQEQHIRAATSDAELRGFRLAFRTKGKLCWAPSNSLARRDHKGITIKTRSVWVGVPIQMTELVMVDDQGYIIFKIPYSAEYSVGQILRLNCTLLYELNKCPE